MTVLELIAELAKKGAPTNLIDAVNNGELDTHMEEIEKVLGYKPEIGSDNAGNKPEPEITEDNTPDEEAITSESFKIISQRGAHKVVNESTGDINKKSFQEWVKKVRKEIQPKIRGYVDSQNGVDAVSYLISVMGNGRKSVEKWSVTASIDTAPGKDNVAWVQDGYKVVKETTTLAATEEEFLKLIDKHIAEQKAADESYTLDADTVGDIIARLKKGKKVKVSVRVVSYPDDGDLLVVNGYEKEEIPEGHEYEITLDSPDAVTLVEGEYDEETGKVTLKDIGDNMDGYHIVIGEVTGSTNESTKDGASACSTLGADDTQRLIEYVLIHTEGAPRTVSPKNMTAAEFAQQYNSILEEKGFAEAAKYADEHSKDIVLKAIEITTNESLKPNKAYVGSVCETTTSTSVMADAVPSSEAVNDVASVADGKLIVKGKSKSWSFNAKNGITPEKAAEKFNAMFAHSPGRAWQWLKANAEQTDECLKKAKRFRLTNESLRRIPLPESALLQVVKYDLFGQKPSFVKALSESYSKAKVNESVTDLDAAFDGVLAACQNAIWLLSEEEPTAVSSKKALQNKLVDTMNAVNKFRSEVSGDETEVTVKEVEAPGEVMESLFKKNTTTSKKVSPLMEALTKGANTPKPTKPINESLSKKFETIHRGNGIDLATFDDKGDEYIINISSEAADKVLEVRIDKNEGKVVTIWGYNSSFADKFQVGMDVTDTDIQELWDEVNTVEVAED